jgi:hypothetical protein
MSETRTAPASTTPAVKLARVKGQSIGLVFMLVIQFILGIAYSLYGTIPASGKTIGLFSNGWLIVHGIMGIALLGAAGSLVVRVMGTDHGFAKAMSWIGLISIIAAFGAGVGFTRNVDNGTSLVMSLAFALALVCYVLNIVRLPGETPGAGS